MFFVAVVKLIIIGLNFCLFFILHTLRLLFSKLLFLESRPLANKLTSVLCRVFLKTLRVRVCIKNPSHKDSRKHYLYISNHLSYLDVVIYYIYFPCTFVTSKEIKETPFLGHVCMMANCFFVERRTKKNLIGEINQLADILAKKMPVMIFPEATSTDGSKVLPFKSPLFKACIKKEVPVLPLTLNYNKIDHIPVNLHNRDKVCWYGDMPFAPHIWQLAKCRLIEATITISPSIYLPDHRKLAAECHKRINASYKPWEKA